MAYDFYVRSKQDLIDAVEEYGIIPYFSTSIPGFSLEEHCSPARTGEDAESASASPPAARTIFQNSRLP